MKNKPSGDFLLFPLALAAVTGVLTLIFSPDLIPGGLSIPAWLATALAAAAAVTIKIRRNAAKKVEKAAEKEKRLKRTEQNNKKREQREARAQAARDKAAQKDAEKAARRSEEKTEMVKQATTIWAERAEKAQEQATIGRGIFEKSAVTAVRDAAGLMATEWEAATTLAKWTSDQIITMTTRPDVKSGAQEELREAMMEVTRIKEMGSLLTEKQANEIKELKEKAMQEKKADEARQDEAHEVIRDAEVKWNTAEARAERASDRLREIASQQ